MTDTTQPADLPAPIRRTRRPKALPMRVRYAVLQRCNFACFYCGLPAPIETLVLDHVVPLALGGNSKPWNLVAACGPCNAGKGASAPDRDLVDRVRDEWSAYAETHGHAVARCDVCGLPIPYGQLATDEEPPNRCDPCDVAVCTAYEAGRAHA